MTDQTRICDVHIDDSGLALEEHHDEDGPYYRFPTGGPTVSLPLPQALRARIRPVGTADAVLEAWSAGRPPHGPVPYDDPAAIAPTRVRAGGFVFRDDRMLVIRLVDERGTALEIPGGGVDPGESPEQAVIRELAEETGLSGTVVREVAQVWRTGQHQHYFLLKATGEVGAPETLDNYGGAPDWVPVCDLPNSPIWPRRLGWRIAEWYAQGWPEVPAELFDAAGDLDTPCRW